MTILSRRGIRGISVVSLSLAMTLLSVEAAHAQLQVDPSPPPTGILPPRVYIGRPAGSVLSREVTTRIVAIEEDEAARLEMVLAANPNQADVIFGTIIVDAVEGPNSGCTVKGQVRIVATKEVLSDSEDCSGKADDSPAGTPDLPPGTPPRSKQAHAEQILRAVRMMAPRLLARAAKPIDLPPLPLLPPPPPEDATAAEPSKNAEKTDGWVFELGLDELRTRKFIGLGQIVANRNSTDRFGGVFALTFVRNDMKRFAGVLQFAFGRSDAQEIRAPFGVGLVRNRYGDFAGLAAISLVINHADSFTGLSQIALYNSAEHFVGAMQLGGINLSRHFVGIAQLGLGNYSRSDFEGIAQVGVVNLAQHELTAIAQIGAANASFDGKLNAAMQVAALANVVEQEVRVGVQASPANVFGRFKGGVQFAAANFVGSKSFGDFFEHFVRRGTSRTDFQGALQVGALNANYGGVNAGAQLGAANLNGRFAGGMQVGAVNFGGEYEGAFQLGVLNVTMTNFRGFAAIGGGNITDHIEGGQLGIANIAASTVHGAQIGVFNYTETLTGIQLGLLNCTMKRETLPCLPIANLGF